jgi:hypothetical protein
VCFKEENEEKKRSSFEAVFGAFKCTEELSEKDKLRIISKKTIEMARGRRSIMCLN